MSTDRVITSPYLAGHPARKMRAQCAYCCHPLTVNDTREAYRLTKDHILPRARGRLPRDVWNIRPACYRCNQLRARLNHCSAILVLMLEEARIQRLDIFQAMADVGVRKTNRQKKDAKALRRTERLTEGSWEFVNQPSVPR